MIIADHVNVPRELSRALGRRAARNLLPLVVRAVMLVAERDGTSVANPSPRLPHGASWPHSQGDPMVLLLDLDLGAVRRVVEDPLLPAEGRLLVFADGGYDRPIVPAGALLHLRPGEPPPPVVPPAGTLSLGDPVRLAARPGWSLPDLERRVRRALGEDDDAVWAYSKFYRAMSIDHELDCRLRWAQIFGEVDGQERVAAAVSKEADLDWPDRSPSKPSDWRPSLTAATELDDGAELTYWLRTDLALPERLDRPSLDVSSG